MPALPLCIIGDSGSFLSLCYIHFNVLDVYSRYDSRGSSSTFRRDDRRPEPDSRSKIDVRDVRDRYSDRSKGDTLRGQFSMHESMKHI